MKEMDKLRKEKLRAKIHEVVSKGCRLCDYWDAENYHCMLNIPIHPAYPCVITDQILNLKGDGWKIAIIDSVNTRFIVGDEAIYKQVIWEAGDI